jgi:hypothetical protein
VETSKSRGKHQGLNLNTLNLSSCKTFIDMKQKVRYIQREENLSGNIHIGIVHK